MKHKLEGVCSKEVSFRVEGGRLRDVEFYRGCPGNLKALALLLEGMKVQDAARKLRGITCGDKTTSCSDQLARVLEKVAGES